MLLAEYGIDYSGSSNSKELNYILNKLMIRRLKKDVLSQLPPKTRKRVEIPVTTKYQKELSDLLRNNDKYVEYMNDPQKAKILVKLQSRRFIYLKKYRKISIKNFVINVKMSKMKKMMKKI